MIKILTCDCKILMIDVKEIHISYTSNNFECSCGETEHEVFAIICPLHPLNFVGFSRDYFTSTNCRCVYVSKDAICNYCR